jgi:hypothetical protein
MSNLRKKLEGTIGDLISELMDYGGTTPPQTYGVLLEDHPELCALFDKDFLVALCKKIQQSDLPAESQRFQSMFDQYNAQYFGGGLPPYSVRVVFDVNFWANEYFANILGLEEFSSAYIDSSSKRILIRYTEDSGFMTAMLLDRMACANLGDFGENDAEDEKKYQAELERLRGLGVPLANYSERGCESPGTRQIQKLTAKEVFGK